jgi:hypothetical protein
MGNLLRINNITGSPKQNQSLELHSEEVHLKIQVLMVLCRSSFSYVLLAASIGWVIVSSTETLLQSTCILASKFSSVLDCDEIMQAAAREMNPAETTEGDGNILRRHCRVAWLDHDTGIPLIKTMGRTTGNLLLTDDVKGCPKAGCEKLQVLHYFDTGGEFVLHHDGVGRVLTVIYYLNGVAGTWFPLADKMLTPIPQNRDEALRYAQDCIPDETAY